MNINPAYRANELRAVLNQVQVKALVMAEQFRDDNLAEILGQLIPSEAAAAAESRSIDSANELSPWLPSLERIITISDKILLPK